MAKSLMLEYVKGRDTNDSEHNHMFKLLRKVEVSAHNHAEFDSNIAMLFDFYEALQQHQLAEFDYLTCLEMEDKDTHILAHQALEALVFKVLNATRARGAFSIPELTHMKEVLREHIITLDADLTYVINREP